MTYTAATLHQAIGQTVNVRFDSFQVTMRVLNAKVSYGVPRVLVTPATGTGEAWIDATRCRSTEQPTPATTRN